MAHSANQEQAFSPLDQSGVSNFALGERKLRIKCPLFQPISIQCFWPLCYESAKILEGLFIFTPPPPMEGGLFERQTL